MESIVEMRCRPVQLETRARNETSGRVIAGYAVKFGEESVDLGRFVERIAPHAFDGVDMRHVLCLYNHQPDQILARADSGTLALRIDDVGLYFEAQLPDTTLARDVCENIQVGNIKGCSFGFTITKDRWETNRGKGKPALRTVEQVGQLLEITITPIPAYQNTDVARRSFDQATEKYDQMQELVQLLRFEEE